MVIKYNRITIGVIASNAFTIDSTNPVSGFSDLVTGINLNSMATVKGSLQGVADKATRLESMR